MRISAPWLHSGLRTLVLGALVAAAWVVFGTGSAQASGALPPLTDAVDTITGTIAAPLPAADVPAGTAGPVEALLEPADAITGPLATQVHQVIDPALAPVDAALAPVAAPVTSVVEDVTRAAEPITAIAADALNPVTASVAEITVPIIAPVAELTAPLTGAIAEVAVPVLAEVTAPGAGLLTEAYTPVTASAGSLVVASIGARNSDDLTTSVPAPEPTAPAFTETMTDALASAKPGTDIPDAFPTRDSTADPGNRLFAENGGTPTAVFGNKSSSAARMPGPAPELPAAPADFPVTTPSGTGTSSRTGGDAGPTPAADLTVFQLSLGSSPLRDALRTSEELPGSVSLDHGFSPD